MILISYLGLYLQDLMKTTKKKLEIHDIPVETEHSTLLISFYYYYCYYFCFWCNSTKLILSCFIFSSSTACHSTASSVSSFDVNLYTYILGHQQ